MKSLQKTINTEKWNLSLKEDGTIDSLQFKKEEDIKEVYFREGEFSGIKWYGEWDGEKHVIDMKYCENSLGQKEQEISFIGEDGDLSFSLTYKELKENLALVATVKNNGCTPIQPVKCGLKLGIDSYMAEFPAWNSRLFPTLLRCENTHFWGYCMSPEGQILGIASKDPIASWSLEYNTDYGEPPYVWGGHRVETFNLDLINALPLPKRHPQDLYQLMPEEEKSWTIYFVDINELKNMQAVLSPLCEAPMISIDRTTILKGEASNIKIYSEEDIQVKLMNPNGDEQDLNVNKSLNTGVYEYCFNEKDYINEKEGVYKILVKNSKKKCSEAILTLEKSWSWNMKRAREAALKYPPRATTHCESWYGLYTLYRSEKYFHNEEMLKETEEIFNRIYPLMFDEEKHEPIVIKHRIQNTTAMINILVDRYKCTGDITSLEKAANLTDWIINCCQTPDGAYRARKTHYTCVIYPAKNIMELLEVEKELGRVKSNSEVANNSSEAIKWNERYKRHYISVKAAIDELVKADGNIDTEGQLTFEDGMISCCAAQIGLFALLQEDIEEKEKYKNSALKMLTQHRCLTNLIIPDGRQRGATRRFWESQYDVGIQPNMLNSPHGWTSWRTYATWYAYLLTGEEDYLTQTMNALGSCIQMIDIEKGKLRWAFVPDPYVAVRQISKQMKVEDPKAYHEGDCHTLLHPHREYILGEQYVDMISDWHEENLQDNDVHEHFKCLEEIALTKAYIIERENGEMLCWNCNINIENGVVNVNFTDEIITELHINLKQKHKLNINFDSASLQESGVANNCRIQEEYSAGMQWINKK